MKFLDALSSSQVQRSVQPVSWEQLLAKLTHYPLGFQTTYGTEPAEPIPNSFIDYVLGGLQSNGIIFALELKRIQVFSQARFQFQRMRDGRPGDLFGDRSLSILERPWAGGTTGDMLARMLIHADFAGNGWQVELDGEIVQLRPDWVEIILEPREVPAGENGEMVKVGWRQKGILYYHGGMQAGEKPAVFLPGEYSHFAPIPDPLATYRGMSWLTPVIREIQADTQATKHKLKFFENAATPNLAISLPKEITPDQFKAFVDAMDAKHKGAENAYQTLYTAGGADVTVIGQNMQQLDFKVTQGAGETRLAAAAGIHPVIAGLSEGMQGSSLNAGNYTAAKRNTVDTTFRHLWQNAAGSLETLVPPPDDSRLWYDARDIPFLAEDMKDRAEIQQMHAATIRQLTDAGFTWESVVAAVVAEDMTLLKHSGMFSVQLQPPGSGDGSGPDGEPHSGAPDGGAARARRGGEVVRHPAPPPHEQWMHGKKGKNLAAAAKAVAGAVKPPVPAKASPKKLATKKTATKSAKVTTEPFSGGPFAGKKASLKVTADGEHVGAVHQEADGHWTALPLAKNVPYWAPEPPGATKEQAIKSLIDADLNKKTLETAANTPATIADVPSDVRKAIFDGYKAQPKGQLLHSPAAESFDNLVAVAHVYGGKVPGGVSPKVAAQIVDEQLSKNQGITNHHLLQKKLTDWLATSDGAAYAKSHTTPNKAIVDSLTGKVKTPTGVKLAAGEKVQKLAGPGKFNAKQTNFKSHTSGSAQKLQDDYMAANGIKWNPAQTAALKNYTGGGYTAMNNYLRGKHASSNALTQKQILDVQSAMVPLQENAKLIRGAGWDQLPAGFQNINDAKKLIGKTIQEPAFMSTTVGGATGHFSQKPVTLLIEAPVGTQGVFVKKISLHPSENEMLLAAGQKFRVMSVDGSGSKATITLRVVTPK